VSASLTALFILGAWSGTITARNVLKSGLRMFIIGGAAIGLGMLAGKLVG
jgi:VIT1/CCC1 family predicted Fe2+/Mn2+ transporter